MPFPNTSPAMSPIPTTVKSSRLDVVSELPEVALDGLPGAAGRDAHLLVVVADRAARGERVAEPEAGLLRDAVGDVGEARRALVGGHHQVGVVAVVAHHVGGRHDLAPFDVVREVEQAADEGAVAEDDLVGQILPRARRPLDHEATLGAHRHDHGVLDHLGLHQPEHLGAEVLAPVRPAQPAAGHPSAAQVHSLDARRVDEDLVLRARLREPGELGRVELERQLRQRPAVRPGCEEVGAQHRPDGAVEHPQDLVLVEALHGVDGLVDPAHDVLAVLAVPAARVEAGPEQRDQQARDLRVGDHHRPHVGVAEVRAGLAQVLRDRAQHGHLAPGEPRAQHQPVVAVALDLAAPGAQERVLEALAHPVGLEVALALVREPEVVDPDALVPAPADRVGPLVGDLHAHVLEQRHHVRERERPAGAVELGAQHPRPGLERPVEVDPERVAVLELLDVADVRERRARDPVGAVGRREGVRVAAERELAALLAQLLDERLLEVVDPRAGGRHEHHLDLVRVELGHGRGVDVGHVVEPHQHGLGHPGRVVDRGGAGGVAQDGLDPAPVLGVEAVARHEHEQREEAPERVAAHEQPQPLALAEVEDAHRDLEQLVARDLEQLVARVGVEDLDQRLLVVAPGRERGALEHSGDLAPQDRHLARLGLVGLVGVEAEEAPLAHHLAVLVEALDAHVVEVGGAVDGGPRVRLGEVEDVRLERERANAGRQLVEAARALLAARLAQDPEAALGDRVEAQLAVLGHELVVAVAEEGELVVLEPLEERRRLLRIHVALGHRAARGSRPRARAPGCASRPSPRPWRAPRRSRAAGGPSAPRAGRDRFAGRPRRGSPTRPARRPPPPAGPRSALRRRRGGPRSPGERSGGRRPPAGSAPSSPSRSGTACRRSRPRPRCGSTATRVSRSAGCRRAPSGSRRWRSRAKLKCPSASP